MAIRQHIDWLCADHVESRKQAFSLGSEKQHSQTGFGAEGYNMSLGNF
jgi:hypothetical protein